MAKLFLRLFCALLFKVFEPSEYLPPSPVLGTLSSIALNGGEGRGEEALLKTFEIPAPAPSRPGVKSPLVAALPRCVFAPLR